MSKAAFVASQLPSSEMANDRIFLTFVMVDILFVIAGGLLLIFALTTQDEITETPTLSNVARDLVLAQCPLNGWFSRVQRGSGTY